MRFGVREICDVVLRAKAKQTLGNRTFYKNEPVLYFDTLKTSTVEGAATTVYATGGRGNSRLIAWEGERTVTFTMEDALISPEGFAILSGAGLVDAAPDKPIWVHVTSQVEAEADNTVRLVNTWACWTGAEGKVITSVPGYEVASVAVGEDVSALFIKTDSGYEAATGTAIAGTTYYQEIAGSNAVENDGKYHKDAADIFCMKLNDSGEVEVEPCVPAEVKHEGKDTIITCVGDGDAKDTVKKGDIVLVDYYIVRTTDAKMIEITADKFAGNYYLEASTLFRRESDGVDMPAEFIIPNGKIQSNFTFSMASSGDPSELMRLAA